MQGNLPKVTQLGGELGLRPRTLESTSPSPGLEHLELVEWT